MNNRGRKDIFKEPHCSHTKLTDDMAWCGQGSSDATTAPLHPEIYYGKPVEKIIKVLTK